MKRTKSARIAMLRLADVLGWSVRSDGRQWEVDAPASFHGLRYTSVALLCCMTRVIMAPLAWQGGGLTRDELFDKIRFVPQHNYNAKEMRHYLDIDGKIAASDESTMYAAFHNTEGVDYVDHD